MLTHINNFLINTVFVLYLFVFPINLVLAADITPPIVTSPPAVTIEATAILTSVTLGTGSAADDIDGVLIPTADNVGPFNIGTTTVTWSAVDAAGNIGTATQLISIIETTVPIITTPANINVVVMFQLR